MSTLYLMKKLLEGKKQKKVIISACRKIGLEGELCYKARKVWIRRNCRSKKLQMMTERFTAMEKFSFHDFAKVLYREIIFG